MCKVYAKPKMNREIHKASPGCEPHWPRLDRKSTRLNSSHSQISYAVFCVKKKVAPDGRTAIVGTHRLRTTIKLLENFRPPSLLRQLGLSGRYLLQPEPHNRRTNVE